MNGQSQGSDVPTMRIWIYGPRRSTFKALFSHVFSHNTIRYLKYRLPFGNTVWLSWWEEPNCLDVCLYLPAMYQGISVVIKFGVTILGPITKVDARVIKKSAPLSSSVPVVLPRWTVGFPVAGGLHPGGFRVVGVTGDSWCLQSFWYSYAEVFKQFKNGELRLKSRCMLSAHLSMWSYWHGKVCQ